MDRNKEDKSLTKSEKVLSERVKNYLFSSGRVLFLLVPIVLLGAGSLFADFDWSAEKRAKLQSELIVAEKRILDLEKSQQMLEADLNRARIEKEALQHRGRYIAVSTTSNRVFLMDGNVILRECVAATGRNEVLWLRGKRHYFRTPAGRWEVTEKVEDPVWVRPDWYWLEKGKPVPPDLTVEGRKMKGMLGKYALRLRDGYLIHGTTDPSSLGQSVTHGCVRLGKQDLAAAYKFASVGMPVFIY